MMSTCHVHVFVPECLAARWTYSSRKGPARANTNCAMKQKTWRVHAGYKSILCAQGRTSCSLRHCGLRSWKKCTIKKKEKKDNYDNEWAAMHLKSACLTCKNPNFHGNQNALINLNTRLHLKTIHQFTCFDFTRKVYHTPVISASTQAALL